jgi:hypothetical protein
VSNRASLEKKLRAAGTNTSDVVIVTPLLGAHGIFRTTKPDANKRQTSEMHVFTLPLSVAYERLKVVSAVVLTCSRKMSVQVQSDRMQKAIGSTKTDRWGGKSE